MLTNSFEFNSSICSFHSIMKLFTCSSAVGLFLLLGTGSASHINSDTEESNNIGRLRSIATKNLRVSSSKDKAEGNKDLSNRNQFEEDEELWERILQQDLSLTFPPTGPPTPPPITAEFTLMPTTLPIMAEDEECELMVRFLCVTVDYIKSTH